MKEKYLFELGGENTELGKCEALEVLKTENYNPELILDNRNIISIEVSRQIKARVIERFAMVKRISRIIFYGEEDEIDNITKTFSLNSKKQESNLIDTLKIACRKFSKENTGKKPFTNINLVRI